MVYFYERDVTSGAAAAHARLMVNIAPRVQQSFSWVFCCRCLMNYSRRPESAAAIHSRGTKGGIREEIDAQAKMREGVKAFIEVKEEKWNEIRKWGPLR